MSKANETVLISMPETQFRATIIDCVNECLRGKIELPAIPVADELLTTEETAAFLKTTRQTISNWRNDGKIPFVRVGSLVRFRKSDLLGLNSKKKAA